MTYAIDVKGLSKRFGSLAAVDDLSFQVEKGRIFGFLGPNGSGKSTTIRMLCGILTPSSGTGNVLGYNIMKEPELIRQNIGYMSQKFSLYQDLSVEENLNFYGGIYSVNKKKLQLRIEEIKNFLHLEKNSQAIVETLSGGWKQRVALGCALLHEPQLLFLDEPTAGVDPVSRRIFWNLLKELAQSGVSILVTTHYMDEAEMCDTIGIIYQGKLMSFGTPGEIHRQYNTDNIEDAFINLVTEGRGIDYE
ncbi:MAG: ABC transporter ATP-binding protein [Bacillota bacterium]